MHAVMRYNVIMHYYDVSPLKIVRRDHMWFTYHSERSLATGQCVTIPVGQKSLNGVILKEVSRPTYATKQIDSVLPIPPLPQSIIATALWLSRYYDTHLATVWGTLLPAGIAKRRRTPHTSPTMPARRHTETFSLNADQQRAITTINQAGPGTVILHGITGSGKTAIYIELARQAISAGQSIIVLIPEIALTPQLVAEFQQHFPDIIVTHSRQTEAERHRAWQAALSSTVPRIAIGPRSALFLPLAHLRYIIIDEAHEPSYKQDKSPRYSALRAASILAHHHNATVIHGSATPLVNEYYLAEQRQRPIITLSHPARPHTITPTIQLVDLTKRTNLTRHRFLSDKLLAAIDHALANDQQVLLFHNRRGSAAVSLCMTCGWAAECPHCFVPLTLHADQHRLRCHICSHQTSVPTSCPDCHNTDIVHRGIGTKLIESEVAARYPRAIIRRFDSDTATENQLDHHYQALYDGAVDIIIGTQVVAKGLDLPHLGTVGVIQADAGLMLPDYSAEERTFQLLAQVVGRVGRSNRPTTVVVQTFQPHHPAITTGITQNFAEFYRYTIAERRRGDFPPFAHLLKLTCIYKTEAAAIRNSSQMAQTIRQQHPAVVVCGPTPSFYERQRDTYRWQIIIKSTTRSELQAIAATIPATHWHVDIDPYSLL